MWRNGRKSDSLDTLTKLQCKAIQIDICLMFVFFDNIKTDSEQPTILRHFIDYTSKDQIGLNVDEQLL